MTEKTFFWKNRVVYQIYPRSFADSNGDGIGDLPGIIVHLDELADLGVGIIWLSPVYKSPNCDNGYDISDYRDINPEYGTMEDMDRLIREAQARDIKIVMDLVINHTSDQHEWFISSREKDSPYRDYYIWRKGKNGNPPNNWTSFFAEDCWVFDEKSKEYYLHLFAKGQPDLNYHNPKVIEEVKDIMRFWLGKGVGGFRCDVINIIYKSSLEDGKKRTALTGLEHYLSQPGTHEILQQLRSEVLDKYNYFTVGETVFVTPKMAHDLCDETRGELDMLFSFEHMETDCWKIKWFHRKFSPKRFFKTIAKWQGELEWNANYLENHDQPRSVSRFGDDKTFWTQSAKMLGLMLLTLKGTPFVYQGQEIGMTNFDFKSMQQIEDVESHNIYAQAKKLHIPAGYRWKMIQRSSRDNARTPMQWDSTPGAGFTAGTPWLGINGNFVKINVKSQMNDSESIRSFYKNLIAYRSGSDLLQKGEFELIKAGKSVFAYKRVLNGKSLTILLNFSKKPQPFAAEGKIELSTANTKIYNGILLPYEGVILS